MDHENHMDRNCRYLIEGRNPLSLYHRNNKTPLAVPCTVQLKFPGQEEILQEPPDFSQYPIMVELVKQAGPLLENFRTGHH